MISPVTNRRTAGSSIVTSTIDKPYGARRTTPYKNLVLSGEKPTALEGKEGEKEGGSTTSKLYGPLSAGGSTSRLDHMSTKSGIPGSKPSQMEQATTVSLSQPNLHRIPGRSKSDPRLIHRMQQKEQRKDSTTDPPEDTGTQKSPSLPRRMLKHPSSTSIPSSNGRLTPTEPGTSGRATPSKLSRPSSRLTRPGTLSTEGRVVGKELSSDEKESDCTFRRRSSSETKKAIGSPRNLTRTAGELCGIPGPGGLVGGARPHQKSATLTPDSRIQSPSVLSGDESKLPPDRQKSTSSSESGSTTPTIAASPDSMKKGLQLPSQRKLRALGPNSLAAKTAPNKKTEAGGSPEESKHVTLTSQKESDGSGGRKKTDPPPSEKEKTSPSHASGGMSKLAKPTSFQRLGSGGTSPGEIRKSPLPPSGLSKLQSLSSSQGFISGSRGSKVTHVDLSGRERPIKGGRKETTSSNSSLESAVNSEQETRPNVKLEKRVSSTSSSTTTETEKPKAVLQELPLNKTSPTTAPLAGGKDNRRISPEGMAPEGQTLSNESIPTATESRKNSINLQDKPVGNMKTKLIEEVGGKFKNGPTDLGGRGADGTPDKIAVSTRENGEPAAKIGGAIEVGVASESEIQTPNLSQGSEVATDSTLSSLSIASVSSPPHNSIPSLASFSQQPETGQAPYSNSSSPHGTKHSSLLSHAHHMSEKTTEIQDPPPSRHYSPAHLTHPRHLLRSPLKKKEKAKRARSLSPNSSRRIFPLPPSQPSPSVNVTHHDTSTTSSGVPQPSPVNPSFPQLELTRTDSPESVKSDLSAYSLSRKPLRSSLRTTRDKDSSSSSVDSGKVIGSKVTISPRSSQVIYFKDEAVLQVSTTQSQPTILSPAKRMMRGRPSSLSDTISVDSEGDKRGSRASEQLDMSETETFLTKGLVPISHHRYDSTPEVCRWVELL